MDYKTFTANLGDFLIGTQVLLDNLASITKKKEHCLCAYKEIVTSDLLKGEEGEEYIALAKDAHFFLHDVAMTFIDLDDFIHSEAYENACARLNEARQRLYKVNAALLQSRAR